MTVDVAGGVDGHTNGASTNAQDGSDNFSLKAGLAKMLKGGVIMDVVNAEQVTFLSMRQSLVAKSDHFRRG